jgi:hypothetical protein
MRELLYYFNEQSENLLKKQTKSTTQKETKYKKPAKQVVNEVEINRKLNALSTVSLFIYFFYSKAVLFKKKIYSNTD